MKLFGIRIRLHPTFIWLLIILFLVGGPGSVAWVLLVFTFVVLHELSHSLVAKAHGVPVRDITLLPIGGVARLGAMPEEPRTEFMISIAGPALNFAIVGLVYLLAMVTPWGLSTVEVVKVGGVAFYSESRTLLGMILVINLVLGTFNLLPAFPMDGGRLFRAYLASKRGYLEATRIAARVGRWIAGGMVAVSIGTLLSPNMRWNPWLLLIAVFIYVSGKQEEMAVAARHAMRGFWRFFGHGQPAYDNSPGSFEVPPSHYDDDPGDRPGVIDVEGSVRDGAKVSAADAFRKLAEESESRLGR